MVKTIYFAFCKRKYSKYSTVYPVYVCSFLFMHILNILLPWYVLQECVVFYQCHSDIFQVNMKQNTFFTVSLRLETLHNYTYIAVSKIV